MCGSIRFLTPEPYSHGSITGWRTITQNTHIPAWAIAHRGSTLHHSNPPSVRSNGVNSTYSATSKRAGMKEMTEFSIIDVGEKFSIRPIIETHTLTLIGDFAE